MFKLLILFICLLTTIPITVIGYGVGGIFGMCLFFIISASVMGYCVFPIFQKQKP